MEKQGFRGSITEKLMILAITGGVPWYLELLAPDLSAVENIRQLCFEKDGVLMDEFQRIFHDLFGKRSEIYRKIVGLLCDGPKEYQQIAKELEYSSGGPLSDYLNELVLSGYVVKDKTWKILSGKESALFRYRLRDNYLRFYLKYIFPHLNQIEKNRFSIQTLSALSGWDTIMGFQFENLVLNNREVIHKALRINPVDIVYDNPYFQHKTNKHESCQIDYLIQTRYRTLYICEMKFSKKKVGTFCIAQVQEKIKRLQIPKGFSCVAVLIHVNGVSDSVKDSNFFIDIIDFSTFLEVNGA